MPNMDMYLSSHNRKVLEEKKPDNSVDCNCDEGNVCPLEDKCMTKGVVYEATVFTNEDNTSMKYVGSASTTFKARLYNHRSSFTHVEKKHQTALSNYYWKKKEEGMVPEVNFRILSTAAAYTAASGKCSLCLQEKVYILLADKASSLNRKSEIGNKCRHRWRHTLEGWKPGATS